MPLILLYPPGPLYALYRGLEDALEFAKNMHERQLALRSAHFDFYDPDAHATVLAFNLRVIGRKMDALITSFRTAIRPGSIGGVSQRTADLQTTLQQYNAAVACRDACDNPLDMSINALDLAFDCLASIEEDVHDFEQRN